MSKPTSVRELDPGLALRDGTFDARAVLLLWCYRQSWLPLLWIGLITMTLAGIADAINQATSGLVSVGEWLPALLTPLAGVALSLAVRLTSGWIGWALAYPLTRWTTPDHYPGRVRLGSRIRLWMDRVFLTRAYRSLRWTSAVRNTAAARLGRAGRRLRLAATIITWSNVVLLLAYVLLASLL